MKWTPWDSKELNRTAYSIILIFFGGFALEISTHLEGTWKFIFLAPGIAVFILGIFLGFVTIKQLNDKQIKLEKRINQLEEFFGIKSKDDFKNIEIKQKDTDGKHTKLQSYTLIGATAIIAFFTIVLVVITIYQYNIENFEPIVDMTDGMITIVPGFYPSYNNTDGISISAITNHNLRFTVVNASIFSINHQYGKCFFSTLPTIRSFDHTSIMFGKNADVKTLVPEVSLDYAVNSTFLYPPSVPITSGGYELAILKFDILMEDLQDESKNHIKTGYSDIIVKLPYQRYNDLISNCTLAHKQ